MAEQAVLKDYEYFDGIPLGKKDELPNGCWNCGTKHENKIGWYCHTARRQVFPLSLDGRTCEGRPKSK